MSLNAHFLMHSRAQDSVSFRDRSTASLEQFEAVILGHHGQHVRSLVIGNGPLDSATGSSTREQILHRILAGLSNLEGLFIQSPALLPTLTHSLGLSLRILTLNGDKDSPMSATLVASFVQASPNLEELTCSWVGPCVTGEFVGTLRGLRCLKSLEVRFTAAVDATFAFSTGWMPPLRRIDIDWDDQSILLPLILPFLSNFAATLSDLTLELAEPFPVPSPPLLLPHLTTLSIYSHTVTYITPLLRLSEAPVRTLQVRASKVIPKVWHPVPLLARQLKATLRRLILVFVRVRIRDGTWRRSAYFGSDAQTELEEFCRMEGVEIEMQEEDLELEEEEEEED